MGDVNLEIKLSNLDERVIKIEESGGGSGGDLKTFIINFTCDSGFIGKTVTMEFQGTPHAGEVVENVSGTVASDGALTLYPMNDGLWKYYATSDESGYREGTITLEKWGNYPVKLKDIPNGATVTPTDDVQTWLHCANIWDKTNLTTIDDVIAATTTLNTLISDNNASDYLVRSTTWASDVCSNESAMTYIGLNDYCANTLLSNSTWYTAICNSSYSEKIIKALILPMTSNTGSDGSVASASSIFPGDYYAYKAFDNNISTFWLSNNNVPDAYITYEFNKDVTIYSIDLINTFGDNFNGSIYSLYISADDNVILTLENNSKVFSLPKQKLPPTKCKTLKVRVVGDGRYVSLGTVQVYGREA